MIKGSNIIISQSITNALGLYVIDDMVERVQYCPKKVYAKYVSETYPEENSKPMEGGRYAETKLLGSCARGGVCETMPEKKSGGKSVTQQRIDIQVDRMNGFMAANGAVISPLICQIPLIAKWSSGIWLRGEMDIFPAYVNDRLSIIDYKNTKDVNNKFFSIAMDKVGYSSKSCWGKYEQIAKNQPLIYHFLARNFSNTGLDGLIRYNKESEAKYRHIFSLDLDYSDTMFYYFVTGTGMKDLRGQLKKYEYEFTGMRKRLLEALIAASIEEINNCVRTNFKPNPKEQLCRSCKLKDECLGSVKK